MTASTPRFRPAGTHPGGLPQGSLEDVPPFELPGEHFAAALVWLALGSVGLVIVAPALAQGAFLGPRVIAVTHCFTLGWIATSIFGALYQLSPVALGVTARSVRAGHLVFWALQAGVAALVAGTWWWRPALLALGWVVLLLAVLGLAWNLLPPLRGAPRGRLIARYVLAGQLALGLALATVAARVGAELGWWPLERLGYLTAHAHLALVGFATLTAVGVSSRLLPMFLLSHGHAEWPLAWIGPALGTGLVAFALGELAHVALLTAAGGVVMAAAMALYLHLVAGYFRHRTRRALEPGLALVVTAFVYLAAAAALGLALLAMRGSPPRLIAAYGVTGVLGWLSLLVAGMYRKIVPFLTWLHRFSARVGQPGVPRIADLTSVLAGWATLGLLAGGVALLACGVAAGATGIARLGAVAFAAGTAALLGEHGYVALR